MDLTVEQVTVDCADPQRLAAFWAAALEGTVSADWGEFVVVSSAVPGLAHLGFQRADDPTPGKNRLHIDFQTADRGGTAATAGGHPGWRGRRTRDGLDPAARPGRQRLLRLPAGRQLADQS
jgi:hypothetical protein